MKKNKLTLYAIIFTITTIISVILMTHVHSYFIGLVMISSYMQGFVGHAYAIETY